MEQFKIIISDCHLSGGHIFEGALNPHEDFHFDEEMCDFFRFFSTGEYGEKSGVPAIPVEVELFINGDFFDFLNVPFEGEFEDVITEDIAVYKIEAMIKGHPKVMAALRAFASKPGKKITYMIGNHDADLFFPKVREIITRTWDPQGQYPSEKVTIVADRDHVRWEGGVEVHHGNQFEAVHVLNFEKPLLTAYNEKPVLNIPWGSFYVLKIVNRLKIERDYLDKVRPIRVYVLLGLIFDPWFTIRYMFLSGFYFLKTRFVYSSKRRSSIKVTARILKEQSGTMLLDLEAEARQLGGQARGQDRDLRPHSQADESHLARWQAVHQYGHLDEDDQSGSEKSGQAICADFRACKDQGRGVRMRATPLAGRERAASGV